ncbi:uncharacterized protein I303_105205 [Kwoniella dejecticola CBS 10117]|uniref:Uncharacterized protein n=1 Tax=Kwoniella dejecticola CBS 10117 TaxID=1296121 RepID=A0A1A6A356_9TREE|nr:uncharacterized protein I303_05348 [Kwoniella dejecticola CBS 10117]OBR84490.1 hypothetical protein I303_05348 [Kwoniella dejecticola CBS 10117]
MSTEYPPASGGLQPITTQPTSISAPSITPQPQPKAQAQEQGQEREQEENPQKYEPKIGSEVKVSAKNQPNPYVSSTNTPLTRQYPLTSGKPKYETYAQKKRRERRAKKAEAWGSLAEAGASLGQAIGDLSGGGGGGGGHSGGHSGGHGDGGGGGSSGGGSSGCGGGGGGGGGGC